jgi:hypothetical protein
MAVSIEISSYKFTELTRSCVDTPAVLFQSHYYFTVQP